MGVNNEENTGARLLPYSFSISYRARANYFMEAVKFPYGNNIYLSTNNASTWLQYNMGITSDIYIYNFIAAGGNFLAGTSQGLWIRPISDSVTAVKVNKNKLPNTFSLSQNYPNPFNPSTSIEYQIPKSGLVTLKVYDVLGREVETLVNEEKPAVSYEVRFEGSSLSSGIYFYRIQAGDYALAKKMILMK